MRLGFVLQNGERNWRGDAPWPTNVPCGPPRLRAGGFGGAIMKLENWALVSSVRGPDSRYTAPELVGVCLVGDVYGDDRRFNGTRIRTSLVISIGSGKARTFSERMSSG